MQRIFNTSFSIQETVDLVSLDVRLLSRKRHQQIDFTYFDVLQTKESTVIIFSTEKKTVLHILCS